MSDYGIKTYADLAETCRGMVLAQRDSQAARWTPVERGLGTLGRDIQWYIVQDPSFRHGAHRRSRVLRTRSWAVRLGDNPLRNQLGLRARAGNPLTHRKGSSIVLLPYLFRLLVLLVRIGPVLHAATGTPCRLVLAFLQAHELCLLLALVLVGKGLLG